MDTVVDPDLIQASVIYVGSLMMFGGLAFFMGDNPVFVVLMTAAQIFVPAGFAYYTGLWPFYFISIIYIVSLLAALLDKKLSDEE